MSTEPSSSSSADSIRTAAGQWTVRRDRGLSSAEAIEFELWIAADPRHAAAMRRSTDAWTLLDRMSESTVRCELAAAARSRQRRRRTVAVASFAVAAALAVGAFGWWSSVDHVASTATLVAVGPRTVTLADGTTVRLNAGGELVEDFSAAVRRVRLTRGEAHFT